MRANKCLVYSVFVLLLTNAIYQVAAADLEGLDEQPTPVKQVQEPQATPAATQTPHTSSKTQSSTSQTSAGRDTSRAGAPVSVGFYEGLTASFLGLYLVNFLLGRSKNARIAAAWAKAFTGDQSIFDKNFSHCDGLTQEAGHVYKFYATGRRHVQGLLATIQLCPRQDLLSTIWSIVQPFEDTVVVEALMQEASMPPIVMAVATPKAMRRLLEAHTDLEKYTRRMQPSKEALPGWNHTKLQINAEHSTIVSDLLNEPRVLQALFVQAAAGNAKTAGNANKYFRSLHFTNDCTEGSYKRVLRFTFALPSPEDMDQLTPLLALVPMFIDLVGSYKLSPDLKKRAEASRSKAQESNDEETKRARLEALAARKQEKLLEEKARLARLPPAERQKAEEKLQKKMMEKAMKKRTKVV